MKFSYTTEKSQTLLKSQKLIDMNTIQLFSKTRKIYLFTFVGILILSSCKEQKCTKYQQPTIETINYDNDDTKTKDIAKKKDKSSDDDMAIGNIHMNTSESQFEAEKKIFLKEHPKLGGLSIKSLKGFFYDNRLAAIEIISEQQNIHKNNPESYNSYGGWQELYRNKYQYADKSVHIHNTKSIDNYIERLALDIATNGINDYTLGLPVFVKNHMLIEVSDYCDSPKSHDSFEDVIKKPKKECYGHKLQPIKLDETNATLRSISVLNLIEELPYETAKKIKKNYFRDLTSISDNSLNNIQAQVAKIVNDEMVDKKYFQMLLPMVEAHRNTQLDKIKNSPSWSFIIIYYKPLLDKYRSDQKAIKEKEKQENRKELDII